MDSGTNGAKLIEAIVAIFRDFFADSFERLSSFSSNDWQRAEAWLDTSGLSFYFLDRLLSSGKFHVIPPQTLQRLEDKFDQNKLRCADMLQEFLAINHAFRQARITFANLKGFTLSPVSCPDVHLRRQADLDFLVDPQDLNVARGLLEARGYTVKGENARTLEMEIGITLQLDRQGRYKPKHGRCVELHTSLESVDPNQRRAVRDERLNRLSRWAHNGEEFPALAPADQMLCQAVHILGHLRGEHTRLSWLLEFQRHVLARREDALFWDELRSRAENDSEAAIALGLSTLLTTQLLGAFAHPDFNAWTVTALPPKARLWALHFGSKAVLAAAPGTKLFLLLEDALADDTARPARSRIVRRLIPTRPPQRILQPQPNAGLRLRIHRALVEFRFISYRLRFHWRHGLLHLIEARRWRTLLKQSGQPASLVQQRRPLQSSEETGQ